MKKACKNKCKEKKQATKREYVEHLTADELMQWIMDSGLTVEDIVSAAHSHGIDLKFNIKPAEGTSEDDSWMNAPAGIQKDNEDPINPSHYQDGGIETIDFLEAKATPEEFEGYCKLNAMKYLSRAGKKERSTAVEDKQKAVWYLNRSLEANYKNTMK